MAVYNVDSMGIHKQIREAFKKENHFFVTNVTNRGEGVGGSEDPYVKK